MLAAISVFIELASLAAVTASSTILTVVTASLAKPVEPTVLQEAAELAPALVNT